MDELFARMLPAFFGALVALFLKPLSQFIYSRIGETRAYFAHTADRIRDFRESVAVLESILLEYDEELKNFPVDNHISKIKIPDSISASNAIDLFALSSEDHANALKVSNMLFNVSRDAESILASKHSGDGNYDAFMRQCYELADKLRNLAQKFEEDFPRAKRIFDKNGGTSDKVKEILWENGSRSKGIAFSSTKPSQIEAVRKTKKW